MFLIEIHAQEGHAGLPGTHDRLDTAIQAATKLYERWNGHIKLTRAHYVVSENGGQILYSTKFMSQAHPLHKK